MLVRPFVNLPTDMPTWVSREDFLSVFDQEDFLCRETQDVEQAYRADWFEIVEDGLPRFILPVVNVVAGKTQFINGRHRVAVLLKQMAQIPIAFAMGYLQHEAIRVIDSIPKRPLALTEVIQLPDLPIQRELPSPAKK